MDEIKRHLIRKTRQAPGARSTGQFAIAVSVARGGCCSQWVDDWGERIQARVWTEGPDPTGNRSQRPPGHRTKKRLQFSNESVQCPPPDDPGRGLLVCPNRLTVRKRKRNSAGTPNPNQLQMPPSPFRIGRLPGFAIEVDGRLKTQSSNAQKAHEAARRSLKAADFRCFRWRIYACCGEDPAPDLCRCV